MAKIDTTQIAGYESMTAEEKLKALEELEYEDNLDELQKQKKLVTKANGEAADWKRKHNALLTEEQKKEQERKDREAEYDSMKEEIASLKKTNLISDHKAKLLGLGYDEELATETATAMADGDTAKVFENQQKFLKAHDKQFEAELLKKTPRNREGGSGGDIDYEKKAAEAQLAGDFTSAAHYMRLAHEKNN